MNLCKYCIEKKLPKYSYSENLEVADCKICNKKTPHIPYELLRDKLFSVLQSNYACLSDLPKRAGEYYFGYMEDDVSTLSDIIENLELEEELSSKLIEDLPTDEPHVLYHYELDEYCGGKTEEDWERIENSFRYKYRFFNTDLNSFLDKIFSFVTKKNIIKKKLINIIPADTILYRGRSFDSLTELLKNVEILEDETKIEYLSEKLVKNFGLVPPELANDQRMTPYGISTLYLCSEKNTCLAEIRAVVGQLVGVAQFSCRRGLRLLDLNTLQEGLESFHLDENYKEEIEIFNIFRKLITIISKPKLNNDKFDYLISQYFFEYLRINFIEQLDGVLLRSIQNPHQNNIIIFQEATSNGIDNSKNSGENLIYFSWMTESLYGIEVSKIKSVEIRAEAKLCDISESYSKETSEWW